MPTPMEAFDAVARLLSDPPDMDQASLERYYVDIFPNLSEPVREAIGDFIVSLTEIPTPQELAMLKDYIENLDKGGQSKPPVPAP